MAKTKKAAKKSVTPERLTDDQIDELASRLHGTCGHVYNLCKSMFGVDVGEEIFDWLAKAKGGGVFKCEQCNEWQSVDCRSSSDSDWCASCMDDIDRDDDFDEDGDE